VIEQKISAASVDHGRRPSPTQPRPAASWAPTATSPTGRPPCRDGTFADLGRGREPGATHPATALGGVHAHTPRARRLQVESAWPGAAPKVYPETVRVPDQRVRSVAAGRRRSGTLRG
jgi:hypothetical protein